MSEQIKNFFDQEWSPAEKILLITDCLLLGLVIGMIFSPLKSKFHMIGCNNGNNSGNGFDDFLDEEA